MKKWLLILAGGILLLTLVLGCSDLAGRSRVKNRAWAYLQDRGYTQEDVARLSVEHYYLNRLLGYDYFAWKISVEFACEPEVVFEFNYRDEGVVLHNVTGKTRLLDKDEQSSWEAKCETGKLKKEK